MSRFFAIALTLLSAMANPSFAYADTIYFVRHFEKAKTPNPPLTDMGAARAESLKEYFEGIELAAVYSTNYQRTMQTAKPTADAQGLQITQYDPRDLAGFVQSLDTSKPILIVGHSNTTPDVIRLMGGDVDDIDESEYGTLYILQKKHKVSVSQVEISLP